MPSDIDSDIGEQVMAYRMGRHANRLRFAPWVFGSVYISPRSAKVSPKTR